MLSSLRYAASVVTTVTYGFRAPTGKETEIVEMNEVIDRFLVSSNPGQNLVDAFPILDNLPDFLSPWRKDALEQQAMNRRVYGGLLSNAISRKDHDSLAAQSFAAKLAEESSDLSEEDKSFLCGSAFEAGVSPIAASSLLSLHCGTKIDPITLYLIFLLTDRHNGKRTVYLCPCNVHPSGGKQKAKRPY